jgi:hypothetical protein
MPRTAGIRSLGGSRTRGSTTWKDTFGRRQRAAGVPIEPRKVRLGRRNGEITSDCSAPDVEELLEVAKRVCGGKSGKTPALTVPKTKTA